jgi:midasin (ATPase involved in ribosome maturation)
VLSCCCAHADVPAHGSMKDVMVGMELLIGALQEWQNHSASDREQTSLAPHQQPLAALSARWRRLELSSWMLTVSRALDRVNRGAYVHWFHLMAVCFPSTSSAPCIADVLPVIEQFLQSSPLGQFESRLGLLTQCAMHCDLLVLSGKPEFTELAVCLKNVHSYYAQHLPAVNSAMQHALDHVKKEMKV